MYFVKEMYHTIQGEGRNTGQAAVFLRFTGCNLWSGLEKDRASAVCSFCDTDFVGIDGPGGGKFESAHSLASGALHIWNTNQQNGAQPYIVCTGGEPLLQMDQPLVDALHDLGFKVAVETNGTVDAPNGLDWICVSPKSGAEVVITKGTELKLVFPQSDATPDVFEHLDFEHFYLQPMDGPDKERNTELATEYCKAHPKWKLSIQTHKVLGIP